MLVAGNRRNMYRSILRVRQICRIEFDEYKLKSMASLAPPPPLVEEKFCPVMVRFFDDEVCFGHYKWPATVTEKDALQNIFASLNHEQLACVVSVEICGDALFLQQYRDNRFKYYVNQRLHEKYREAKREQSNQQYEQAKQLRKQIDDELVREGFDKLDTIGHANWGLGRRTGVPTTFPRDNQLYIVEKKTKLDSILPYGGDWGRYREPTDWLAPYTPWLHN